MHEDPVNLLTRLEMYTMPEPSKWAQIVGKVPGNQYQSRIKSLEALGLDTSSIEKTVDAALKSMSYGNNESFVIFGEPQSGKTEMMIALNAKLIDEGCEVIINLVTDSVDLLEQNLSRFRAAGLSPSPKQFLELPSNAKSIKGKQWIVFCKKNARDLEKLTDSLRFVSSLVIIDDEADYASPNAKVNSNERTKINHLIYNLLKDRGQYIGVTATPARLDLNNTFENKTERWVYFSPHPAYVGQDFFFPQDGVINYRLHQFEADEGDERKELRNAVLHFLCGVAEQHQKGLKENFSMLVHTSGKTLEHQEDFRVVERTLHILSTPSDPKFEQYVKALLKVAEEYSSNPDSVAEFVLRNINRHQLFEINSKNNKTNVTDLLTPRSLFSFGVGGNIISRGVTFENLLSMYFTRSVKGRLSQDTYIQRARMFGNRGKYKDCFQLWIPKSLMENWTRCFAFHQLAIQAIQSNEGAPVWLSDHKISPTATSSIDRSSVDFEDGEMSWGMFDYQDVAYMGDDSQSDLDRLATLRSILPESCFPSYVYKYLTSQFKQQGDFCFHDTSTFGGPKSNYTSDEIASLRRKKGIFSTHEFSRGGRPHAKHHLKIFSNPYGKARLFYKVNGQAVRFMQNRR